MGKLSVHQQYHLIYKILGYTSISVSIALYIMGYIFADVFGQNFLNFLVLLTIGIFCINMEIKVPKTKTKQEVIDGAAGDAN